MSGECDDCGEHTLDCRCNMITDIKVWAQMFFDDGSVSEGIRVSSDVFDSTRTMKEIAIRLLKSLNRDEGLLLVWGAGDMFTRYYDFTSSQASESDS